MKKLLCIGLLLFCSTTWAGPERQPYSSILPELVSGARRSPHYYTVSNVFRNHDYLLSKSNPLVHSLAANRQRISLASLELIGDVAFQNGGYEFQIQMWKKTWEAHLQKRRGDWVLELFDLRTGLLQGAYTLQR